MNTITKILNKHNLSIEILNELEKQGIVNGIGGQGQNIERYIKGLIDNVYGYDKTKANQLFNDIRTVANLHDFNFYYKRGFIKSNLLLARDIFLLFNWVSFYTRLGLAIGIFITVQIYGKKFYK